MKPKLLIALILLIFCFSSRGLTDINATTQDLFGLNLIVRTPHPGVQGAIDTVRTGDKVFVRIEYKNLTNQSQMDFKITVFFPNQLESYMRLREPNPFPSSVDKDSIKEATWELGTLAPSESGRIEFNLIPITAPKDTIYLSYSVAAQARWSHVSQISHTNIYIPSWGVGVSPLPNLWIEKKDEIDEVFPGDTITYKIHFGNIGETGGIPAENVAIIDSLPSGLTYLDGNVSPSIMETLPDGRTALIWELLGFLPYSTIDSMNYRAVVNLSPDRDSLAVNRVRINSSTYEIIDDNNYCDDSVWVIPQIDLAIEQKGPDSLTLARDDTQEFVLTCINYSSLDLDNIQARVRIDDGIPDTNIYHIQIVSSPFGRISTDGTLIVWDNLQIASQESIEVKFNLLLDNVERSKNYRIHFTAEIDTVVKLPTKSYQDIDTSDNHDEWLVKVDATPDLSIKIVPDEYSAFTGDTRRFTLICKNNSDDASNSIGVRVSIDDHEASNIYTFSADSGLINSDTTNVEWTIPALAQGDSLMINFRLIFDSIKRYDDYFVNLYASIDTLELRPEEHIDNEDSCQVTVDAIPNFAIEIREEQNRRAIDPGATLNFILTCRNSSAKALKDIKVLAKLNDGVDASNIYTLSSDLRSENGQANSDTTRLEWIISPLDRNGSDELHFSLTFDKIEASNNYIISMNASIDSVEKKSQELINNTATWQGGLNAAPDISLGPITVTPAPELKTEIVYAIPFSNIGNFPAHNAVMTIEIPEYTYLLYYIEDDSRHSFEDSTITTFQIPLGDLPPGFQGTISVGVIIYSYKELPDNVSSPLILTFNTSIQFDEGQENASKTDEVIYPILRTSLYLDKNIAETGSLPVEIIFTSGDFGDIEIKVYNLAGEFIRKVYEGAVEKGDIYRYYWNGLNENGNQVVSGVYFIYAITDFYKDYKKVIIVK